VRTPQHQKWFIEASEHATDWSFALRPLSLIVIAGVILAAVAWRGAGTRLLPTPELRVLSPLGRLVPYLPRLLAIHLGISLLALAVRGRFLAHDLLLEDLAAPVLIGLLEGALGVWFITGIRLRWAAIGLIVIGPWALTATGPVSLLEGAELLGVAAFLAILPPGDSTFGQVDLDVRRTRWALLVLRLGVGIALISLAFSEKLANPSMARATLEEYPQLDVFALVGLTVSPDTFVLIAGATELLFGLLVISGALPQLVVLVAAIPFNLTLIIFGTTEMIGHLPIYGVFLVLLAYGSSPVTAPWVRWFPRHDDRDAQSATASEVETGVGITDAR
jgi:uncharacterized membrane protein YphA (DoxX/SURF4 family)